MSLAMAFILGLLMGALGLFLFLLGVVASQSSKKDKKETEKNKETMDASPYQRLMFEMWKKYLEETNKNSKE